MAQLRSRYADVLRLEADIRARLGPRHPDVVSIAAQTAEMRRAVAQELARYVATVRQDYERSRASEASLTAKLDDLKRQVTETGGASVRLRALERNAEASRVVYASFLSRSGELNEQRGINTSNARFISRALQPQVPSGTSKAVILAGGIVVGLMLGLGLAILRDQTDDRFFDRHQVEQASGLPVLAELPRGKSAVPGALATLPGLHRIAQGWARRARSRPYVVLFVAAGASSDTRTIAYDLAIAGHVNLGPALLVDGDLQNGVLSRRLGVSAPGHTASVLLEGAPLVTSIVVDTETGVAMLPSAGGTGSTPLSSTVTGTLTAAAHEFGVIIVDAASPLQDPTVFGFIGAADEILLVCQAGRTRRADLVDSLQALGVTGPKVTGILLA
jgi:Mrp family chromosome partitioning ATPase